MSEDKYTLQIVFENCDVIEFLLGEKNKTYIIADKITRSISWSQYDNKYSTSYTANSVYLDLYRKDLSSNQTVWSGSDPWDRLKKSDDITQIHLITNGEEAQWFFVDWKYDTLVMTTNPYQENTDLGDNIEISINKR